VVTQSQAHAVATALSIVRSSSWKLSRHSLPSRQAALHRQRRRPAVHAQRVPRRVLSLVRHRRRQRPDERHRLDRVADISSRDSLRPARTYTTTHSTQRTNPSISCDNIPSVNRPAHLTHQVDGRLVSSGIQREEESTAWAEYVYEM